jgi:hypothetical protein
MVEVLEPLRRHNEGHEPIEITESMPNFHPPRIGQDGTRPEPS